VAPWHQISPPPTPGPCPRPVPAVPGLRPHVYPPGAGRPPPGPPAYPAPPLPQAHGKQAQNTPTLPRPKSIHCQVPLRNHSCHNPPVHSVLSLVLRAQRIGGGPAPNSCASRERLFQDVRSCRRRPPLGPAAPVAQLFLVANEWVLLWQRAILARTRGVGWCPPPTPSLCRVEHVLCSRYFWSHLLIYVGQPLRED